MRAWSRRRSAAARPSALSTPRRARDEDLRHAELLGDRGGVQRAGAAEGEQGEVARVDAALDGHDPHRADHLGVRDADDPGGAVLDRQAELVGQRLRPPRARRPRRARRRRPAASSGSRWPRTRFASVTVGSVAAAAVAGGSGLGARRARPDAQRAARVAPADRAAARADGVDVDHRQRERPAADLAPRALAHRAALDDADVAGRAAHVEAQQVGLLAARGEQGGRGGAARPGRSGR